MDVATKRGSGRYEGFARPVEHELVRAFDGHGIVWEYEPLRYVLERAGRAVRRGLRAGIPSPELDLYIGR